MEKYLVVIGRTSTGYSAHSPDVLGCAATGRTVEETIQHMKQALEFHFEGMVEDGDNIPRPRGVESYRDVVQELDTEGYLMAHVQFDMTQFAAPAGNP